MKPQNKEKGNIYAKVFCNCNHMGLRQKETGGNNHR